MLLTLNRKWFNFDCTIGVLLVNGIQECFTLEDVVRINNAPKIPGMTAIPSGSYRVIIDYSDRFQKLMPLLLYVQNFKGIRIHSGNTAMDTEGCILVGEARKDNSLTNSRKAFRTLFAKMSLANKTEKIFINIMNLKE